MSKKADDKLADAPSLERCGIVMPLSEIDGCSVDHWAEVKNIISDSIEDAGFDPLLVSDSDDIGVIHKRIIQNLYQNPIVVCDVSGKNPNVMFELGLRLAFDRPTIIVKDNMTSYSFDTQAIEHIEYPRDLRFTRIVDFKEKLTDKISNTYTASTTNPEYTTFLKHFGEFKVPEIKSREVPQSEFILDEIRSLRRSVDRIVSSDIEPRLSSSLSPRRPVRPLVKPGFANLCLRGVPRAAREKAMSVASAYPGVGSARLEERSPDHFHLLISGEKDADFTSLVSDLSTMLRRTRTDSPT